jgi:hypothetical protein
MHNVHTYVWSHRTIQRLVSDIPVRLAEVLDDVIAEGPVSNYHSPFLGNSIDVWDPKLDFSMSFQVIDDGQIWQWRIAEFVSVEGRGYKKWVSSEIDLESLDQIHEKLASLRNPVIKPEPDHMDFKLKVERFYHWLDEIRRPILSDLERVHEKRRVHADFSKFTKEEPPLLSRFEMFTVRDSEIYTKFFAEPVFFRGCRQHAIKAEELTASVREDTEIVDKLDEIYQERASSIILGAGCIEAFINGLGFENFPSLWESIEKFSLESKWQLYLELKGKGNVFDLSREPYQSLTQLKKSRDSLMHFKCRYKRMHRNKNKVITYIESDLAREFVRDLPNRIEQLIQELCQATALPIPPWLTPKTGWLL